MKTLVLSFQVLEKIYQTGAQKWRLKGIGSTILSLIKVKSKIIQNNSLKIVFSFIYT